jgi:signal peptidase I
VLRALRRITPRGLWPWFSSARLVVVGSSMHPLLHPGDLVLFDRLAYSDAFVARGDIVVFKHATAPSGRMLKIVAGLPGEQLEVRQDRLWVNERELIYPRPMVGSLPGCWMLGPDEVFVLSAAVAVGNDSRSFGPVAEATILGQAWFVLPPSPRAGRLSRAPLALR